MSRVAVSVVVISLCSLARAQEPIPAEHAQKVGKQLEALARQVDDAQIKTDVDADKAMGIHADQRGALAIPQKGLSEDVLSRAESKVVPIGQLWFRGVAPVIEGQAAGRARLRPVKATLEGEEHELFLFLLGARKKDSGDWELLVYGKDKEPLVRLPLKKSDGGAQDLPIRVDGKKIDDDTGELTLKLLGKFEAAMTVGKSPE